MGLMYKQKCIQNIVNPKNIKWYISIILRENKRNTPLTLHNENDLLPIRKSLHRWIYSPNLKIYDFLPTYWFRMSHLISNKWTLWSRQVL